ncbi:Alpha/beta hydrolase family-domain-containing protein [Russula compacta]|nr:Alpha/beta hydrolase family-domain-containing protein [Russula compacta]
MWLMVSAAGSSKAALVSSICCRFVCKSLPATQQPNIVLSIRSCPSCFDTSRLTISARRCCSRPSACTNTYLAMPALQSQSYVFDARPHYPLLVSVKRYWAPGFESTDADAATLILAHATSFHKELWEPVLEELFAQVAISPEENSPVLKIRDAWAIECPNHGESAILNEETLLSGYTPIFSWEEYARAIHLILNGFGKGIDVDFNSRNLVGVGHSMGASAIILTRTMHPVVPLSSAILVEPMFVHPDYHKGAHKFLVEGAVKRRDVWSSREEAHKLFRERSFKSWDPRCIDLQVRYGLRELPTSTYPDKTQGVTLSCTKVQEAATYGENHGRMKSQRFLPTFCKEVPTHVIFGAIADINPAENRGFVKKVSGDGFRTTSVVEDAGHLAVQHNPAGVAKVMWNLLRGAPVPVVPSKLRGIGRTLVYCKARARRVECH